MVTKYENSLFYQVHLSAKCFEKWFEEFFKNNNYGITALEHLALTIVCEIKNCCQRDLAKLLLKDRANTGKLAKALESKGLINITQEIKNNRQVKILTLTKKGLKLIAHINKQAEPLVKELYQKFPFHQIENLKSNLDIFRKTVGQIITTNI